MRLSAYPGHPDYNPEWQRCCVLLDGQPMKDVTHADEERGQIAIYARDRRGNLIVDGDRLVTKILTGRVELRRDWRHVESIGFDKWMCNRIEAAHQEFMKRTA